MRRLPVGAEITSEGVHFRVWAPKAETVEVVLENSMSYSLNPEDMGYFSGICPEAKEGTLYQFRLNKEEFLYPDPASRFQPQGPHQKSQVINPQKFEWTDENWKGIPQDGRIIYEMHIGTFTQQGTFDSAKRELLELANLGITIIEIMPIIEFPGQFDWGYDGVNLYAPSHLYGHPDDLRSFVDHAHALGISVVLDVVYNHFGPDGNYLSSFSDHYMTSSYITEWGKAINFDGPHSLPVREFFISNAGYWIEEFHLDGLRIDATQNIYDSSYPHILTEIGQQVRKKAPFKQTYLVAENEAQLTEIVQPIEKGGYGFDALWNDDFHHTAIVRLTGRKESYYTDYLGSPQEFISALKYGYLYQGQWYSWQINKRGTPNLDLHPNAFIHFIQNHDQIANSAHGLRIHQLTDPGNYRAMTALMILGPQTPMLFQGQEFASSSPFHYFADHSPRLSDKIFEGRKDFFSQFDTISTREIQSALPQPADIETFLKSKLNFHDRELHHFEYALHQDLLRLRRNDNIFNFPRLKGIDGSILNKDAFILRYFGENSDTRLLLFNFGIDLILSPAPDPLFAPPKGMSWEILWSSEDPRYGGGGSPSLKTDQNWVLLGHSAVVLIPKKEE